MRKNIGFIFVAIATLPLIIAASYQVENFITKASPQAANITIDTKSSIGPVPYAWSAFAQGGEEPPPMLSTVKDKLKAISPRYIRIDHIYDFYAVVQKTNGGYAYDFSTLDKTVDDIIATGALPFFNLSYMPPVLTSSGSRIDPPTNWNDWKNLVKATIEHYSGKSSRNLSNVYYEVWNEPELPQFGSWRLGGNKDYRLMYYYASSAAQDASNTNIFYFGGPSVGSFYSSWVTDFLSYVIQNNLRLDFYSWHRYTRNSSLYLSDTQNIRKNLSAFPKYANLPLILSEWGIDSENTPINNTNISAAYTVSSVSKFINDIQYAFVFEIKDGPPPRGGKWGLFTHEKDANPVSAKPRFTSYTSLSKLSGNLLSVSGIGTYVTALASASPTGYTVILSNYDVAGQNTENVPISFTGIAPASYNLKYTYPLENVTGSFELITTSGTLSKSFTMSANTILLLELTPLAKIATFLPGASGTAGDQALVLKNSNTPLIFSAPEFTLQQSGSIDFDTKPLWNSTDDRTFFIFEIPYRTRSGSIQKLSLSKQLTAQGDSLTFEIRDERTNLGSATAPISSWQNNEWHHVAVHWDQTSLSLSVDNQPVQNTVIAPDIDTGSILTFYPIDAAIDELKIGGGTQIVERKFDGTVDR